MRTIKITVLLAVLLSMAGARSFAYDIAVPNAEGVMLYYNYINNRTELEVTSPYYGIVYEGDIVIPESVTSNGRTYYVTSIGEDAFRSCYELIAVTIPNSVKYIDFLAFAYCWGLTSLAIPNSVTAIGDQAFEGCVNLTSMTIPNSVTSIGKGAFGGCSSLTSLYISDLEAWCKTRLGNSSSHPFSNTSYYDIKHLFLNGEEIKDLVLPDIATIGNNTFYGCNNLITLTIPNSVSSIGDHAFDGCSGLTSIIIGCGVTSIGDKAFLGCTGLTSINVMDGNPVYDSRDNCNAIIQKHAVSHSPILVLGCQNTIIPDDVISIGSYAFYGCENLTSVTIPDHADIIGSNAFAGCKGLTSITIPNHVDFIGDYAFYNCPGLKSIIIPDRYSFFPLTVGDYAFSNCIGLTSVTFPAYISSIGNSAFRGCYGLTSIVLPDNEYSSWTIGDYAFSYCLGLTSVTIGNGFRSLGESVFEGCGRLTSLNINCKTIDNWFQSCKDRITELNLGNNVETLKADAFSGFTGLSSISIPNSTTTIGENAFNGCSNVTQIIIGNAMEEIGSNAFANCKKLEDVYNYTVRYPSTSSDAFDSSYIDYVTLHVPAQSVTQYKNQSPWSGFMDVVPLTDSDPQPTGISTPLMNNGERTVKATYDLGGKQLSQPQRGLSIVKMSDGTTKKMVVTK